MKAKFEKREFSETTHISAHRYKTLRNLPHWHVEYELIHVFEGTAELMADNELFLLSDGMSAFINKQDIHYVKAFDESIVGVIKTDASMIDRITDKKSLISPVLENDYSFRESFLEILREINGDQDYREIIAESVLVKLVAEIFRNEKTCVKAVSEETTNNKYKDLLSLISNEYAYITFEEAASYMNLSPAYFSKYFRRLSGMKFTQYLNTLKISAAIDKIAEGKMTMAEISVACGFGTIRNFNRVFKDLTGYTPKHIPKDYVFVYNFRDNDDIGYDPTLNCSEMIE